MDLCAASGPGAATCLSSVAWVKLQIRLQKVRLNSSYKGSTCAWPREASKSIKLQAGC